MDDELQNLSQTEEQTSTSTYEEPHEEKKSAPKRPMTQEEYEQQERKMRAAEQRAKQQYAEEQRLVKDRIARAKFENSALKEYFNEDYDYYMGNDISPDTSREMSPALRGFIFLLILALIGGGLYVLYQRAQVKEWINQQVDTPRMAEARLHSYLNLLPSEELLSKEEEINGMRIYSAQYFPDQHTLLVTVDVPKHFDQVYCFVTDKDETIYAGWYNESVVKYGIAKIVFEQIPTNQLLYIDCVDSRSVPNQGYFPALPNPTRVRFLLSPPEKESAAAVSSEQTASEQAASLAS